MRAFGPEPLTCVTSTPSSRAKRRTPGLACGGVPEAISGIEGTGGVEAGAGAAGTVGAAGAVDWVPACAGTTPAVGLAGPAAGVALVAGDSAFVAAGVGATLVSPAPSIVRIATPSLTLSPTFTRMSFTVPAVGAGTSIVALSLSRVMSESSFFTASPGFTSTSITGTSLKSPISGTFTSIAANCGLLFS